MYHLILADGLYATGSVKPSGSIEVPPRPHHSAVWENGEWVMSEDVAYADLREQRNILLSETDWWCCSDRTPTQAQLDYRTALRDLPANSTPSLDENGNLTGVTWPTKPE